MQVSCASKKQMDQCSVQESLDNGAESAWKKDKVAIAAPAPASSSSSSSSHTNSLGHSLLLLASFRPTQPNPTQPSQAKLQPKPKLKPRLLLLPPPPLPSSSALSPNRPFLSFPSLPFLSAFLVSSEQSSNQSIRSSLLEELFCTFPASDPTAVRACVFFPFLLARCQELAIGKR